MDGTVLSKQYLSQELFDPALKDIKVGQDKTFADFGIGKYIYAVSAKPMIYSSWNAAGKKGTAYNLAITLFDDQKGAVAKVAGIYDPSSCSPSDFCPVNLIGSGTVSIQDQAAYSGSEVSNANIAVPYPISGF